MKEGPTIISVQMRMVRNALAVKEKGIKRAITWNIVETLMKKSYHEKEKKKALN